MYNAAVLRAGSAGEEKSSESDKMRQKCATLRANRRLRPQSPSLEPNLFFIHPDVEEFVNANPVLSDQVEKVVPRHTIVYDTISGDLISLRQVNHERMNTFRSYVHAFLKVLEDSFEIPPHARELHKQQELKNLKKVKPHAGKLYVYHGVDYDTPGVENLVITDPENRSYTFYMETE